MEVFFNKVMFESSMSKNALLNVDSGFKGKLLRALFVETRHFDMRHFDTCSVGYAQRLVEVVVKGKEQFSKLIVAVEKNIRTMLPSMSEAPLWIGTNRENKLLVSSMLSGFESDPKGQELLGPDLESLRKKAPWRAIKRPTLVKIAWQALSCLQAVHAYRLVHRDVKLGNFEISLPTGPNNCVTIKIFDFGLSHNYMDENGDLIDDSTNPDFRLMKYCSFEVGMGCEPFPKDDVIQLSYAILYASGYDFPRKLRCPPDELLEWKRELLRVPDQILPPLAQFLTPFYAVLGELNDLVPVDHEMLKQKIQESLPAHNASASLYIEMQDGEETLV
ncbi:unnamed protein product [Caenorhabditis nigoni]